MDEDSGRGPIRLVDFCSMSFFCGVMYIVCE